MTITLSVTDDEAAMISYSLRELGGRRSEQAVERRGTAGDGARRYADDLRELARRIDEAVNSQKSP